MRLRLFVIGAAFASIPSFVLAQNSCAPPPSGSSIPLPMMIADRPFVATIKATFDQKLPDGNGIHSERTMQQARDRSGRTLFKQQMGCAPGGDGQTRAVFDVQVRDPMAHSLATWPVNNPWMPKTARVTHNSPHTDVQPPPRISDTRRPRVLPSSPDHEEVDLGRRNIAGVEAIGTRTIRTVPAGERGNTLPLVTTTEEWRSEALGITLLRIEDDPIQGKQRFEVTELTQGDPDPSIFVLPADYTIIDADYNARSSGSFTTPAVPSCYGGWGINVGVMKQSPFTADFVYSEWRIGSDGTKRRRIFMPGQIARDSEGRVAIRTPTRSHRTPSQAEDTPDLVDEFGTMVCDPTHQTMTTFTSTHAEVKPVRYVGGLADIFRYLLQPSKEHTMEDLGRKNMAGIPVRGYRWWMTAEGPSPARVTEEWISMDLSLEVSKWDKQPAFESQTMLSHLRSEEPDPALFVVPKNVLVKYAGPPDRK